MQLVVILTIVLATALSLQAPPNGVETSIGRSLVTTLIGGVGVVVVAWVLQRRIHHPSAYGNGWSPTSRERRLASWLHLGVYAAYVVTTYTVLHYPSMVKTCIPWRHVVLIDELLQLAPAILPLLGSWMVLSDSSRFCSEDPKPGWRRHLRTRVQDTMLQARHDLLLPLVPILVLITVQDTVRFVIPDRAPQLEGPLLLICLAGLALWLPRVLRLIWPTDPLPACGLRRQLELLLERAGLTISEILIWKTDNRVVNAATTGVLPNCRYLLLSDGLLQRLETQQLTAIVAHEAGHLRHRHAAILLVSLTIPLFSLLILHDLLTQAGVAASIGPYGSLFLLAFWIGVHSRLARLLEHQADVAACHLLAAENQLHPEAVDQYGRALQAAATGSTAADWLHPSIATRLAVLRHLLQNPNRELEFQRHVRYANRMLAVLALLLLGVWALGA